MKSKCAQDGVCKCSSSYKSDGEIIELTTGEIDNLKLDGEIKTDVPNGELNEEDLKGKL